MKWLIHEVFALAIGIAEELSPFRGGEQSALLPDRPSYLEPRDPFAQYRGSTTDPVGVGQVFYALSEAYTRMVAGLKRAESELESLPPPVADEVRRLQRIVNGAQGKISFADAGSYYADSELGAVGKRGWEAVLRCIKPPPFPSAGREPANRNTENQSQALTLLDRFPATPAGHIAFLEFVRDEVHNAADAKRQLARGYPNATIESMVGSVKWAEAGERIAALPDVPADTVEQVARVLRRELTVGTVEQIDDLLGPAVRALRDAWEHFQEPQLCRNLERLIVELTDELDDREPSVPEELVEPGPIRGTGLYEAVQAVERYYPGGKLPVQPWRDWRGMLLRADEGQGENEPHERYERYYECCETLREWAEAEIAGLQAEKQPAAKPDSGGLIERLIAGPDDAKLTPTELALLEAHLKQPISLATIQQEKQATGESETSVNRNKLKLIRDYNRNLQTAGWAGLAEPSPADVEGTDPPDWDNLLARVEKVNAGRAEADDYEKAIEPLLTALFYPALTNPQPEREIHEGRKRIDITYTNVATEGFFSWLAAHYAAAHVFVECKNYQGEIGNPELDQLSGRFSPSRGQCGLLVCRSFDNKPLFETRCKDTAQDRRGFIIALDDSDLRELIRFAKDCDVESTFQFLKRRFDNLIM